MTTCKYCHLHGHAIDKCPTIVCRVCKAIGHPGWSCTATSSGSKPRSRGRGGGGRGGDDSLQLSGRSPKRVERRDPAPGQAKIYSFESTGSMTMPSPKASENQEAFCELSAPGAKVDDSSVPNRPKVDGRPAPIGGLEPAQGASLRGAKVDDSSLRGGNGSQHARRADDRSMDSRTGRPRADGFERSSRNRQPPQPSQQSAGGAKAKTAQRSGAPPSATPARETINLLYYTRMADLRWADL